MDIKNDISVRGKVFAIEQLVEKTTGEKPKIVWKNDHALIVFTDKQKLIMQQMIEKKLKFESDPANVRFDLVPVVIPPVLKVYGKFAIGLFIIVFLLGRMSTKK